MTTIMNTAVGDQPVIEAINLSKRFGTLTAVNRLNLRVPAGLCFGLLGPNGAGKTTTIEMLEGIIKPSSGSIRLFGEPATKQHFNRAGIQFQTSALQDFLTVKETLALFASFYPNPASITELLGICALNECKDKDTRTLSGGQRQRLLLALALVNQPDLLFLDEPTTGLDPQARRNFWDLIERVKSQHKSIVLTTHYMDEAQTLCDDIAIMDHGEIIARGSADELISTHFQETIIELPSSNIEQPLPFASYEHLDKIQIHSTDVGAHLEQLITLKVPLNGIQIKQANLEDLFLKLTGQGLRGDQ